jgi:hypothetical protein
VHKKKKKNTQKWFGHLGLLATDLEKEVSVHRKNQSRYASYIAKYANNSQQTLFEELDTETVVKGVKNSINRMEGGSYDRAQKVNSLDSLEELLLERSKIFRLLNFYWNFRIFWKKLRQNYKKINPALTIEFFGYLLPKQFREEALGDIYEARNEMRQKELSKASIFWNTFGKIVWLLISSLRIRLSNLIASEKEQNR